MGKGIRETVRTRGSARTQELTGLIEQVYRRDLDQFVRVASAIVGDREQGTDAVQDAFAAALAGSSRLGSRESLEAWLWQTVVNSARDVRRRERSERDRHQRAALEVAPHNALESPDGRLREALLSLTERQREVLFLRHFADLDYRRIGVVLGIRLGTVSATLARAHNLLREWMETNGPIERQRHPRSTESRPSRARGRA